MPLHFQKPPHQGLHLYFFFIHFPYLFKGFVRFAQCFISFLNFIFSCKLLLLSFFAMDIYLQFLWWFIQFSILFPCKHTWAWFIEVLRKFEVICKAVRDWIMPILPWWRTTRPIHIAVWILWFVFFSIQRKHTAVWQSHTVVWLLVACFSSRNWFFHFSFCRNGS